MPDRTRPIGTWADHEIADYLETIEDLDEAARFRERGVAGQGLGAIRRPWRFSGVSIGYFDDSEGARAGEILPVGAYQADASLKGARLRVTLDGFYVRSYPGFGQHRILCEFSGRSQAEELEELKFALQLNANDGERAGVAGKPIFMGLTVGDHGVSFAGSMTNIKSDLDDQVLTALNSPAFRTGLLLLSSTQPVLKPFVGMASSFVQMAMTRPKNAKVFEFEIGLDFSNRETSAALRLGSYVVLQCEPGVWDWANFEWSRDAQLIVRRDNGDPLPLNYAIFGVSRFDSPVAPV